jgi:DNA-binding MarR family transcriptional regulator
MAYDDIPTLREAFKRLPLEVLNSSEASLLWVITSYPEGCFIGQEDLARTARLKLGTSKVNLRKLVNKKLVTKDQSYAHKGVRQCYRANMTELQRLLERYDTNKDRVQLDTPKVSVQLKEPKSVNKNLKGVSERVNGVNELHPYKEYKDYIYDKELFNEFIGSFKHQDLVQYINPGKNLDELLKEVIQQDTSFKSLNGYLEKQNFSTSHKVGGLLVHFINQYLGRVKPGQKSGLPTWCGREGCNPITRLWVEPSYDLHDRPYYECNKCNPVGIKKSGGDRNNRSDSEMELEKIVKTLGEREAQALKSFGFRELD